MWCKWGRTPLRAPSSHFFSTALGGAGGARRTTDDRRHTRARRTRDAWRAIRQRTHREHKRHNQTTTTATANTARALGGRREVMRTHIRGPWLAALLGTWSWTPHVHGARTTTLAARATNWTTMHSATRRRRHGPSLRHNQTALHASRNGGSSAPSHARSDPAIRFFSRFRSRSEFARRAMILRWRNFYSSRRRRFCFGANGTISPQDKIVLVVFGLFGTA